MATLDGWVVTDLDLRTTGWYWEGPSTVATAPSPATSGTSLDVASGDGPAFGQTPLNAVVWPSGVLETFRIPATAEIVRVTGISGDTLTIERAAEGTSARSIVVGDQIAITQKLDCTPGQTIDEPVLSDGTTNWVFGIGVDFHNACVFVAKHLDAYRLVHVQFSDNVRDGDVTAGYSSGSHGGFAARNCTVIEEVDEATILAEAG